MRRPLPLLALALALACLAGPAAPALAHCPCPCPCPPHTRRHVPVHPVRHHVPLRRRVVPRYTRYHRYTRYRPRPKPTATLQGAHIASGPVAGTPPLYQGDLFITVEGTPLWSKPFAGAQELARLPKRTTMINMGRVALADARGRIVAYYYKLEAPNGKVGYVDARKLSPNPPPW